VAVQFPAFCPHCGLIFESRAFSFAPGVKNITFEGSRETCPRCHQWAEIPDGTFSFTEDTIEVMDAPDLTRERLLRVAEILDAGRSGAITDDEAAQAVAEVAPSLAPLVARFGPRMQKALLVFLWAVVQVLLTQALAEHRDHSATKQDVQRAFDQAVQMCLREQP
jgi:hypothetical protein